MRRALTINLLQTLIKDTYPIAYIQGFLDTLGIAIILNQEMLPVLFPSVLNFKAGLLSLSHSQEAVGLPQQC